ncbi:MAG: hypothetical protein AAGD96_17095 [Chloroflexota bacterium]
MQQVKPNIVLIENDALSVSLYERELSDYFNLIICHTEVEATAAVSQLPIASIILEPANGNHWVWHFWEQLKQTVDTQNIPVVFCTILDERKKALERGAANYLMKPVYADVLRKQIQALLETHGGVNLKD